MGGGCVIRDLVFCKWLDHRARALDFNVAQKSQDYENGGRADDDFRRQPLEKAGLDT